MSTPISQVYQDTVSSTTDVNFTPPVGNLIFTSFSGGAQVAILGNTKMELFWDASGNGTNMELISAIYTTGETYNLDQNANLFYNSDGVGRVVIRRKLLGGGLPREVYAQVEGFIA